MHASGQTYVYRVIYSDLRQSITILAISIQLSISPIEYRFQGFSFAPNAYILFGTNQKPIVRPPLPFPCNFQIVFFHVCIQCRMDIGLILLVLASVRIGNMQSIESTKHIPSVMEALKHLIRHMKKKTLTIQFIQQGFSDYVCRKQFNKFKVRLRFVSFFKKIKEIKMNLNLSVHDVMNSFLVFYI